MSQDYEDDYGDADHGGREEESGHPDADKEAAMGRTNVPGILLIIIGVLNLLLAGYFLINGLVAMTPAGKAAAQAQMEQMNPEQKKQMEQLGWDPQNLIRNVGISYVIVAGLGALLAILTITAGAMIRSLRGYGLGILVSILVCVPFLSPVGCCLLGQVVGIWSLVVLFSPDVRAAFR